MRRNQEADGRRAWNGVAAVIAALVGFLALLVSAYTAYVQRQQTRAQVWPRLETGVTPSEDLYMVRNKGMGPAILRSVQVYVGDQAQPDWPHFYDALGVKPSQMPRSSTIGSRVISPGEEVHVLKFASDQDFNAVMHPAKSYGLRLCYCSVLDDCWVLDERVDNLAQRTQAAASCPVDPRTEFRQ